MSLLISKQEKKDSMGLIDRAILEWAWMSEKGYPDLDNENDLKVFESKFGFKLKETALSPFELSKDATLAGGEKKPRIEILANKIQKEEPLELNDGSEFIVANKEEVLNQLKGKTRITTAISLEDKDGNKITTSNLKKTAEFGGGGGMRGGSGLTSKGESAQCIANEIRYTKGSLTAEDITEKNILSTKGKVQVTDFEGGVELLKTNIGWLNSSVSIANELASNFPGPFIQNRGSNWVKALEAAVKPKLKEVGIQDINKWCPADIWMVAPDEMKISWPESLSEINSLLLEKYRSKKIIGVSLKKAGKSATLKIFNDPNTKKTKVEYKGTNVRPTHAKGILLFDDGGQIEFRTFNGISGFQGEIIGTKAAGGKVGYSIIAKALRDNGIELSNPSEIRDQVINNDPDFESKFKSLWSKIDGLDDSEFDFYYDNPEKTPNGKLSYRVSKYLGLEVVNAVDSSDNSNKILNDLINYAASSTNDSAIFVKAS